MAPKRKRAPPLSFTNLPFDVQAAIAQVVLVSPTAIILNLDNFHTPKLRKTRAGRVLNRDEYEQAREKHHRTRLALTQTCVDLRDAFGPVYYAENTFEFQALTPSAFPREPDDFTGFNRFCDIIGPAKTKLLTAVSFATAYTLPQGTWTRLAELPNLHTLTWHHPFHRWLPDTNNYVQIIALRQRSSSLRSIKFSVQGGPNGVSADDERWRKHIRAWEVALERLSHGQTI